MTITVTPIPSTIELAAPAFQLGTTNAAGAAATAVASNSTLLAFDATAPATVAASAVVGSATVSSRRDHVHVGVSPSGAVFTGNVDLGSHLLVGNGGATGIAITANGEITMAVQPCVLAHNSVSETNQTGAGAVATVDFDTVIFDQGGDFASDTFTAPVTGRYLVSTVVTLDNFASGAATCRIRAVASNRTITLESRNPVGLTGAGDALGMSGSIIVDMDVSDTMTIAAQLSGQASNDTAITDATYVSILLVA